MKIKVPSEVIFLCKYLKDNKLSAYVVGGCVRDSILGQEPDDWDITTSATPDQMKEVFKDFRIIETGIQYGTLIIHLNGKNYEITTYRRDGIYSNNRHPDFVEFTTSLEDDLSRRDFTINSLAYDPITTELIDPFNGKEDLHNGLIKCVGVASERFKEDALRMLRAIRFKCQKNFIIDYLTEIALIDNAQLINNISAERIKIELDKILLSDSPDVGFKILNRIGILSYIFPELVKMDECEQNNPNHCLNVWMHTMTSLESSICDLILRWAILFHDIGKPFCKTTDEQGIDHFYRHPIKSKELADQIMIRLKFDNNSKEKILKLVEYHDYDITLTKPSIKRFMNKGVDFELWWQVKCADIAGQSGKVYERKMEKMFKLKELYLEIKNYKEPFSVKDLAINGNNIMKTYELKPGKLIGDILNYLLELVVINPSLNNLLDLIERVDDYLIQNDLRSLK